MVDSILIVKNGGNRKSPGHIPAHAMVGGGTKFVVFFNIKDGSLSKS